MVSVRKLYDIRLDQPVSYTFLHLTIQEYLAALYWSHHPDQQPREFLDSQIIKCLSFNRLKDGHHEKHRPFCLFFAGLANIRDFIDFDKFNRTIDQNHFYVPQMCELLFEAQLSVATDLKMDIMKSTDHSVCSLLVLLTLEIS